MTLFLHRSERADVLADALAELLADPLPDPFATEIVAVPARGMERWLLQRLSHRLGATDTEAGICAAIDFPSPAALIGGLPANRERDPWVADRLVWPLLEVMDPIVQVPRDQRYPTARRLAGLFERYAQDRPDMLARWLAGGGDDGSGAVLPGDLAWQPELWRAVAARIPGVYESGDLDLARLPERVSIFGLTRLARAHREVLAEVAEHRDVHLWLVHPSDAQWTRWTPNAPDRTRNPLLAALGRESRDLRTVFGGLDLVDRHHPVPETGRRTLLAALQRGLRGDETPGEHTDLDLETDDSVSVHACHGPARQVEVLREVLVDLLARRDDLQPRDVLVMCPDIDTYAPLLQAAFGTAGVAGTVGTTVSAPAHPAHGFRVRLADRSPAGTNPLLGVAGTLLQLAGERVTASQVLDLIALPAVRRRFALREDDLARIADWVAASGVRWGLDAAAREPFGMDGVPANTWQFGLDRLLAGVALPGGGVVGGATGQVLALDEVGSSDIALAGSLAELIDRVRAAAHALTGPQPLPQWLDALAAAVDVLTSVGERDAWQRGQLTTEFDRIRQDAGEVRVPLTLAEVRRLFADRMAGRPTRANFRTGSMTICTMVPMRSVPHRVVALLGLDDGVFPRRGIPDGDDVLARAPQPGDRNPRIEDRQLLLDAIGSATDHLVLLYSGADERTGVRCPPAVPLGEVLDTLSVLSGRPVQDLVHRHRLQAFAASELTVDARGRATSYDPAALAGALAAAQSRTAPPAIADLVLPATGGDVIELDLLREVLTRPAATFLRRSLQVGLRDPDDDLMADADAVPAELDNLQRWQVRDRMLRARLAGTSSADCVTAELLRGDLPPGPLGRHEVTGLAAEVNELVERSLPLRQGERQVLDVVVPLPDGRELRGSVPDVHGDRIVRVTASGLKAGQRLSAFIDLLALTVAFPGRRWTAVTCGKAGRTSNQLLTAPDRADALDQLARLADIAGIGLRRALPCPPEAGEAYATKRLTGSADAAVAEARWRYESTYGEGAKLPDRTVWNGTGLDPLLAVGPAPFAGLGLPPEPTVLGALAMAIWPPLLAVERLTSLLQGVR